MKKRSSLAPGLFWSAVVHGASEFIRMHAETVRIAPDTGLQIYGELVAILKPVGVRTPKLIRIHAGTVSVEF